MKLIDYVNKWRQERLDAYEKFEKAQLEYWQEIADEWGTYFDDVSANRCHKCHQAIWFEYDPHGEMYTYTDDEIEALIVAHVRQVHSGQRESKILGDTIGDNGRGINPNPAD